MFFLKRPSLVVKADVKRAKARKDNKEIIEEDSEVEEDLVEQPKWMELVKPNEIYDDFSDEFQYDDGGPECDWSSSTQLCPDNLGIKWLDSLKEEADDDDDLLPIMNILKFQKFTLKA